MAKTTQNMAMAVVAAGLLVAVPQANAADEVTPGTTVATHRHVRSLTPAIATVMGKAVDQSATFRKLVEAIEASDSYVYVNEGACRNGVRACFVSVTLAGANRILRVKVDTRKTELDLIGSVGHELRHTLEVISDTTVTSNQRMYLFYDRIGTRGISGAHETQAAIEAGQTVRAEVGASSRRTKSE